MRCHGAPDPRAAGEFIVARRNDWGYWFDDFEIVTRVEASVGGAFRSIRPMSMLWLVGDAFYLNEHPGIRQAGYDG